MGGCHGMCPRCGGIRKVMVGALLLLNAFVWPQWGVRVSEGDVASVVRGWIAWFAVLIVLGGLVKLFVPNKCAHCNALGCGSEMKGKKK